MAGTSVAERLGNLKGRVLQACKACGRDPSTVRLLAVSKFQDLHKIREAHREGQRDFAENYVQEALEKIEQLHNLPADWHFIGRIQSNKVKSLIDRFAYIHSVDRLSIAEALNRLAPREQSPQKIFVQWNVAAETSKGGADERELDALIEFCLREETTSLSLQGLMVMPPLEMDSRPYFRQARLRLEQIRERVGASANAASVRARHPLDQLSMGTSHDYEAAIAEGATWLRIGSEIFGPREERA